MEFYTDQIQLARSVIDDVFSQFTPHTKLLVFGLGHDSKMWYHGNHGNTFFVEHDPVYIGLNKDHIPSDHIVQYEYKTTVESCTRLLDNDIRAFTIPEKLVALGPFDIIIIDGPTGHGQRTPGRLIPCYWSTLLSRPGTTIYVDDAIRSVEDFCIQKYFQGKTQTLFPERDKCVKIVF